VVALPSGRFLRACICAVLGLVLVVAPVAAAYRLGDRGRIAADRGWDDRIRDLPFDEARRSLLRLKGVGPKVADCVLLFAFGRYEAFPVDIWITRIMQKCYGRSDLTSYEKISRAGREYFGPNAGYAQEYLFCNREAIAGRSRNRKERE
jgi:N-glycosylase/DNA lyase